MSRTRTRTRTRTAALAALTAALALAGCSSDDASDAGSGTTAAGDPAAGDPTTTGADGGVVETLPPATQCTANGELSGDQTATFDEEATTLTTYEDATDFPPAVYQFGTDVKVTLNARADGPGDILVYVNGSNYSSDGDTGIDIAADGSGATVDAELPDMAGSGAVTLAVTVTC